MSTKRERLLDWIRNGDPEDMPIIIGPWAWYLAASHFRKPYSDMSWALAAKAAEETGTHNLANACSPLPFDVIDFIDDIELTVQHDTNANGEELRVRLLQTPAGTLREVLTISQERGNAHTEFFVKGNEDLSALEYFIRKTSEAAISNPAVRKSVASRIAQGKKDIGDTIPSCVHVFCPAVELMSSYYVAQDSAIYLIYENQDVMEALMECHWKMTEVWLEAAAANDIDIYTFAINGYEWLSPDLYERYMIPQAKRICDFARSQGKLSWLHTCGKLKSIAADKAYQQMGIDILESLSAPPSGDIDDLSKTRADIGNEIVTRGGINCELFYEDDTTALRQQAEHVLDSVKGYKHILGDTNPCTPPYPWKSFQAVIDVVRDRGRLFD